MVYGISKSHRCAGADTDATKKGKEQSAMAMAMTILRIDIALWIGLECICRL
jgi:hypothetical protein